MTRGDLPLLASWMTQPHWRDWWGDPAEELAAIEDMVAGRDSTRPFIFTSDGQDAGYIQVWRIADNRIEPWLTRAPWLAGLSDVCVGVDLSIGPAALLGRGLGSAGLAAFVARLRAEGHDDIIIDPDPANARAIAAYTRAGFRPIPGLPPGGDPALVMRHHPALPGV